MKPERRFQRLDCLILIAFTAVGLYLCIAWTGRELTRWSLARAQSPVPTEPRAPELRWLRMLQSPNAHHAEYGFCYLKLFLVVLTPAFLVLRLRQPRPKLRRLARYWGTAGCITAFVFLLATAAMTTAKWAYDNLVPLVMPNPMESDIVETLETTLVNAEVAGAIVTIWCLLKIAKRLRCERTWIENFGIFLCAGWISDRLLAGAVRHFAAVSCNVP
jgi:hypothetical protein